MNFSVCVDAVFNGNDFIEAMKMIKHAEIDTIEFWSWGNKDIKEIRAAKESLGMQVFAFCTKCLNLVNPDHRELYLEGLLESVEIAKELGSSHIITTVGDEIPNMSREEQHKSIINGLKACLPILEQNGITLLVEPLNIIVDHAGYYLYSSSECADIIRSVNSPKVKMLFDIYHQQITEGNLIFNITEYFDCIGHFHAAGNPSRNELYKGEINYRNIFKKIDSLGYKGYIGLEYFPICDAIEGIKKAILL